MAQEISGFDPDTSALVKEAKRIHEDTLFCSAGHTREARFWNSMQFWLGIPSTMIAALAGVTSVAGPDSGVESLGLGANRFLVTGILSLVSAVLVGLMTFLDPKGQAAKHYEAMTLYDALLFKVRMFYEIRCRRGGDAQALTAELQELSEQLGRLHTQTPMISSRAAAGGERAIRAGKYTYAVDKGPESPPGRIRSALRAVRRFFGSK